MINQNRINGTFFSEIAKDILLAKKKEVEGIRLCCSSQSEGAEIL